MLEADISMPQGRGEKQFAISQMVRNKILAALLDTPLTFSQILEKTGLSTATISKYLRKMQASGEVLKVGNHYKLADPDFTIPLPTEMEAIIDSDLQQEFISAEATIELKDEVKRRLHAFGAALDLQPPRGVLDGLAVVPLMRDLARSFLVLGKEEKEHLSFLANLYIYSPRLFLDKRSYVKGERTELSFVETRAAWQVVRADGWKIVDEKQGFLFDYPDTWEHFSEKLSSELKAKMRVRGLNQKTVFKKLRIFSFPIPERRRLIRKGLI